MAALFSFLYKWIIAYWGHVPGTFGKEAVPDRDPMGGVGGTRGTARLSSIISLQLTGQCKHGCAAVIYLLLPHVALCCAALHCCYYACWLDRTQRTNKWVSGGKVESRAKNQTHLTLLTVQHVLNHIAHIMWHTSEYKCLSWDMTNWRHDQAVFCLKARVLHGIKKNNKEWSSKC